MEYLSVILTDYILKKGIIDKKITKYTNMAFNAF